MTRKNKTGLATGTARRFLYVAWILVLLLIPSDDAVAKTATKVTPNRLIHESSPYLLQHATNPVDWYPWARKPLKRPERKTSRSFCPSGTPPVTGAM